MSSQDKDPGQSVEPPTDDAVTAIEKRSHVGAVGRRAEELRHRDKEVVARAEAQLTVLLPRL